MGHAMPPSPPTIEISIASRGISKGLSQTRGPQAVVRAELPIGPIYVAAYAKNVTSTTADGEGGLVAGIRTKVAGLNVSVSAAWRIAISPGAGTDNQSLELAGSVARKFGHFTPQLAVIWSPDDLGSTRRSIYYEASATYGITTRTSIGAAVGRRERTGGPDYSAFNVGITHKLNPHVTADLRYYGSNTHNLGYTYQPGLAASLRMKF